MLTLGACASEDQAEIRRLAMPESATDRAPLVQTLWDGFWLTAIIVGVIVWGLIGFAAFKYRRRSETEIPVQTRYHLPIEVLYTIVPIVMVLVLFFFTVRTQNDLLATANENGTPADHTVGVVGQQWSWTFNYMKEDAVGGKSVYTVGTTAKQPVLVLPVDETVTVKLSSPDVIHSFWVPSFLMKMDVVPGRDNHFSFTPTREGTYEGRCAELCGVYHSRMLFDLKIVSRSEFDAYLKNLEAQGNVGTAFGGSDATTKAGLEDHQTENGAGS